MSQLNRLVFELFLDLGDVGHGALFGFPLFGQRRRVLFQQGQVFFQGLEPVLGRLVFFFFQDQVPLRMRGSLTLYHEVDFQS